MSSNIINRCFELAAILGIISISVAIGLFILSAFGYINLSSLEISKFQLFGIMSYEGPLHLGVLGVALLFVASLGYKET